MRKRRKVFVSAVSHRIFTLVRVRLRFRVRVRVRLRVRVSQGRYSSH